MADILPYLGVSNSYAQDDPAGKMIEVPDLTGFTKKEAEKELKKLGITAVLEGSGPVVTHQLPSGGTQVPGNSQMILYLNEDTKE